MFLLELVDILCEQVVVGYFSEARFLPMLCSLRCLACCNIVFFKVVLQLVELVLQGLDFKQVASAE